ncbi:Uncharacterised protein [Raoultella terrigena]|uniref:Uncharacterized protein n=1 Tax=Raoultella terrigena TaxID=577 RepID=A0A3P8M2W7_RAOTE|nr:Uncharacterised protein [Raoultella terrigena]
MRKNGEVAFGCGPAPSARLIPAAVGEFHPSAAAGAGALSD